MSDQPKVTYWIPLLLGLAVLILDLAIAQLKPELPWYITAAAVVAALLLIGWAGILAYQARTASAQPVNVARGGRAIVVGNKSSATGGRGGDRGIISGGTGGDAAVIGNRSVAKGGDGGVG